MAITEDKTRLEGAKNAFSAFLTDNGVTVPQDAKIDDMAELLGTIADAPASIYTGDDLTVSGDATAAMTHVGIDADGNVILFAVFSIHVRPTGNQTTSSVTNLVTHTVSAPSGVTVENGAIAYGYMYSTGVTLYYRRYVNGVYYIITGLAEKATFGINITEGSQSITSDLTITYV